MTFGLTVDGLCGIGLNTAAEKLETKRHLNCVIERTRVRVRLTFTCGCIVGFVLIFFLLMESEGCRDSTEVKHILIGQ